MSILSLLNVTADTYRNDPTPDGQGGFVQNFVFVATVSCRVRSLTLREMEAIAQRFPKVTTRIYTPPGADILEGDVLDMGVQGFMRVQNVNEPSKLNHHLEINCEKIPPVVVTAATPPVEIV